MRIYEGSVQQFIRDTNFNEITDKIRDSYEDYYGHRVSPSELASWNNSLQFLKNVVEYSSPMDNMVILEYELPYNTQRIDCILFGKGSDNTDNVIVIELKQWEKVNDCEIDENVLTYIGNAERMVPHPSYQVKGYHYYLKDFVEIFRESPVPTLSSCVYCHNYSRDQNSVLFLPKFQNVLEEYPIFTKRDYQEMGEYLKKKLEKGEGLEIFNRFTTSKISPSKKLVEVASSMIKGQTVFHLLDDQITANNTIIDRAKKCSKLKKKSVIIVKGGPGTGKSVIALNALAELLQKGQVVYHATGSKSFTTTLRKIAGSRSSPLFKYFNSFMSYNENEIDVLICDEAHRIRKASHNRFTRKELRTNMPQVEELIKAAKVSIFFIDDNQVVRSEEIGSSALIRDTAGYYDAEIYEFELKTQFRCSGSDGYLNWINDVLQIEETANKFLTKNEKMDFRIFSTPQALYDEIRKKNEEKPNSARLVSGFCWPWSDPRSDGTLVEDVVIGDFKISWEGKEGKKLAKGIPQWFQWAYDPNGVNQCGCIYTIQGFEFDYVGVIFGNDIVYDPVSKTWIGNPQNSEDPILKRSRGEEFTDYVKNIYRVLLTRGMLGCYVYFLDKDTEEFFRSRIEKNI